VVLCFDADSAGIKAAEKAFQILAPTGLIVKCVALPQGEDPDSLIRNQGREAFEALISGAREFIDFQVEHATTRRNFTEMRERVRFADEMAVNIRLLESTVARETTIQSVAMKLGLAKEIFRQQVMRGFQRPKQTSESAKQAESSGHEILMTQDRAATALCRLALSNPEIMNWLRSTGRGEMFDDMVGAEMLLLAWRARFEPGDDAAMNTFMTTLEPAEEAAFAELLTSPAPPGGIDEARTALVTLESERLTNLINRAQTQLKQPGLSPEAEGKLHEQIIAWRKEYLDRRKRSSDSLIP
jgi:DNA primase